MYKGTNNMDYKVGNIYRYEYGVYMVTYMVTRLEEDQVYYKIVFINGNFINTSNPRFIIDSNMWRASKLVEDAQAVEVLYLE